MPQPLELNPSLLNIHSPAKITIYMFVATRELLPLAIVCNERINVAILSRVRVVLQYWKLMTSLMTRVMKDRYRLNPNEVDFASLPRPQCTQIPPLKDSGFTSFKKRQGYFPQIMNVKFTSGCGMTV